MTATVVPHRVESSNIDRIGYLDSTLYISFKSGGVYSYPDVPHSLFTELLAADSVGKAFHARVKGAFPFTKLTTDPFK